MRIDRQIAALRGDPALQRKAQTVLEGVRDDWLEGPFAPFYTDLVDYGEGRSLQDCPRLSQLLTCCETANRIFEALFEPMTLRLAEYPLGQVPLRHQRSNGLSMIQLGRTGRATMTLLCYDELEQSPETISFSDGECHELVLRGAGDFRFVELLEERGGKAALDQTVRRLVPGEAMRIDGFGQARTVERVYGRLVMLRLARTQENARPTRQYSLTDGTLLHSASGTKAESQREMAMALLGRMNRTDAAPLLEELASEGGVHIRWQTLRECLALDTARGFAALSRIASDADDDLSTQAGALRAQLLETYPTLAKLEGQTCPA